jgi:hypothetical protein
LIGSIIQSDQLSCLSHLSSLSLYNIFGLSSIKDLTSIPFLKLSNCCELIDLFSLEETDRMDNCRVQSIELLVCPLIKDFTSLRFIPSVAIVRCDGFTDASQLVLRNKQEKERLLGKYDRKRLIRSVYIADCHFIEDIDILGKYYIEEHEEVDCAKRVEIDMELRLTLYRLQRVQQYAGLGAVSELTLHESPSVVVGKDTSWLRELVHQGSINRIVLLNARDLFPLCCARFGLKSRLPRSTNSEVPIPVFSSEELSELDFLSEKYDVYVDSCRSPTFTLPRQDSRITLLKKVC